MPTLILLRHAKTEEFAVGRPDHDRALTSRGHRQSEIVGKALQTRENPIDLMLCSSSRRTQQTATGLGLDTEITVEPAIYQAGSDTLLALLHEVEALHGLSPDTVAMVGHAPGIPSLAWDLADPHTSDPTALSLLEQGFPTATWCELHFDGAWSELRSARLVQMVVTHG